MNFNNVLSFKGIDAKEITYEEVALEMENFVTQLPPGSPHLRYLRISSLQPCGFKLTYGQKMCLKWTLDLIIEKLFHTHIEVPNDVSADNEILENDNESQEVNPQVTLPDQNRRRGGNQREIVIKEVDLLNIQDIWNAKLSEALLKHNLIHQDFPIVSSSTQDYPYKFKIKCPKCKNNFSVSITHSTNQAKVTQPHYRFFSYTKHVIACMKK